MPDYTLGFCTVDEACPIGCHGWRHNISQQEFYHLVDHHLAFGNDLCEDDLRSFYKYGNESGDIYYQDNTRVSVSDGYNKSTQGYGDSGIPGVVVGVNRYNPDDDTPVDVAINEPVEVTIEDVVITDFDPDNMVIMGTPDRPDPPPIIISVRDSDGNLIGYDENYRVGTPIPITFQQGTPTSSIFINDTDFWRDVHVTAFGDIYACSGYDPLWYQKFGETRVYENIAGGLYTINDISSDHVTGDVILATTYKGILRRNFGTSVWYITNSTGVSQVHFDENGDIFAVFGGVLKKSIDNGASFSEVDSSRYWKSLCITPNNDLYIISGTYIYKSVGTTGPFIIVSHSNAWNKLTATHISENVYASTNGAGIFQYNGVSDFTLLYPSTLDIWGLSVPSDWFTYYANYKSSGRVHRIIPGAALKFASVTIDPGTASFNLLGIDFPGMGMLIRRAYPYHSMSSGKPSLVQTHILEVL